MSVVRNCLEKQKGSESSVEQPAQNNTAAVAEMINHRQLQIKFIQASGRVAAKAEQCERRKILAQILSIPFRPKSTSITTALTHVLVWQREQL